MLSIAVMRVCPECGEPAGTQPFCASCGKNLIHVERLPSREEWEAWRARGVAARAYPDTPAISRPLVDRPGRARFALLTAIPLAAVIAVVVVAVIGGKSAAVSGVTTRIPLTSPSMLPTLPVGGTVRVVIAQGFKPTIGEIVVFHPPAGADPATPICGNRDEGAGHAAACDEPVLRESTRLTLIQRVVAGPGDRIMISGGHVIRNGVREQDSRYTEPCGAAPSCNFPATITIPAGDYFVLGDNRRASDDSRLWGPVPRAYIAGRVLR
jgi:signal peptidase I